MDKILIFKFILASIGAIFPIIVPAQTLPSLPTSDKIRTGRLSNGATYYIVKNDAQTGLADIALVQRVGKNDEGKRYAGETVVQATGALSTLPHFTSYSPFYFMNGIGIFPGDRGYVNVTGDATIYDFKDIVVSGKTDVVDSTLLMVFDIIGRSSGPLDYLYSPQNQAIIISGDIDPDNVVGRMYVLSLMVTKKSAELPEKEYSWVPQTQRRFVFKPGSDGGVVKEGAVGSDGGEMDYAAPFTLTVSYSSPRTPKEYIATVQPLVSERYASELGNILEKRIWRAFKEENLPLADCSADYRGSAYGPGDESYDVSLTVSRRNAVKAAGILSSILGELDRRGVSAGEYSDAENKLFTGSRMSVSGRSIQNSEYVRKCAANFLYGTSLASRKDEVNFFAKKNVGGERGAALFNDYVSALLDKDRNLTLLCTADFSTSLKDSISSAFDASWTKALAPLGQDGDDTLSLRRSFEKSKLKSEMEEPVTGGKVWTFANGIRVVYKQMDTDGLIYYSWLLKGGSALVPGIKAGEAPYLGDVFWLQGISGLNGYDFRNMLESNGIFMEVKVSLSDMTIQGAAPSDKSRLLMKAFLAMDKERTQPSGTWTWYKACESLRLNEKSPMDRRRERLDSVMAPTFAFWPALKESGLSDDLPRRSCKYFDSEFSKMNDGVLILVGDIAEEDMKKLMSQCAGGFSTDRVATYRTWVDYSPVKGRTLSATDGSSPSLDIEASANLNYTTENFIASYIAGSAFARELRRTAASRGWTATAEMDFEMFPLEQFRIRMFMNPAESGGLPASMVRSVSADEMAMAVRASMDSLASRGISSSTLDADRHIVGNYYAALNSDPQKMIRTLLLRYSYGKDMLTNYESKIKAADKTRVNSIIAALSSESVAVSLVRAKENVIVHKDLPSRPTYPEIPPLVAAQDSTGMTTMAMDLLKNMKK